MKKQKKSPEKELNEMEAIKIPDAEFKTMVMRILKDLRVRMDDLSENLFIYLFIYFTSDFKNIYLLIMLLQLSHFPPLTPLHPAHPLPPTLPPYSSCPWVILISTLASIFPILFLPSPRLFSTYHLCYLFSVPFPPSFPLPLPC